MNVRPAFPCLHPVAIVAFRVTNSSESFVQVDQLEAIIANMEDDSMAQQQVLPRYIRPFMFACSFVAFAIPLTVETFYQSRSDVCIHLF
jgi:hypothetical protein